jgi:hypothetical protein
MWLTVYPGKYASQILLGLNPAVFPVDSSLPEVDRYPHPAGTSWQSPVGVDIRASSTNGGNGKRLC